MNWVVVLASALAGVGLFLGLMYVVGWAGSRVR